MQMNLAVRSISFFRGMEKQRSWKRGNFSEILGFPCPDHWMGIRRWRLLSIWPLEDDYRVPESTWPLGAVVRTVQWFTWHVRCTWNSPVDVRGLLPLASAVIRLVSTHFPTKKKGLIVGQGCGLMATVHVAYLYPIVKDQNRMRRFLLSIVHFHGPMDKKSVLCIVDDRYGA